jgi:hypothetical protein
VKRLVYLATAALVAMLILVPSALAAQDEDTMMPERDVVEVGSIEEIPATEPPPKLPKSGGPGTGGPAVILPAAAALLLGSGVLAYGVLRRRR